VLPDFWADVGPSGTLIHGGTVEQRHLDAVQLFLANCGVRSIAGANFLIQPGA
jgi:hypothetical protein